MLSDSSSSAPLACSKEHLWGPLLVVALLHGGGLAFYVAAYGGDLSILVGADATKIRQGPLAALNVGFGKGGYDGQFYYILAQDPWRRHDFDSLDHPSARHSRILYPALAWSLSGGDPVWLLGVMPGINLMALLGLTWVGASLAMHYGRSPWWGCVLVLVLNAGMPALRNLTDPLATTLACASLVGYLMHCSSWRLTLLTIAAVLAREQNAAIVMILLGDALLTKRWPAVLALGSALAGWFAWMSVMAVAYGSMPVAVGTLGAPFAGIRYCLDHLHGSYGRPALINIVGLTLLFTQMALCGMIVLRGQRLTAMIAAAGVMLAILGGPAIYQSGWSYVRVFFWLPLAIWLWSMQSGTRWPLVLLLPVTFWGLLAAVQPWIE